MRTKLRLAALTVALASLLLPASASASAFVQRAGQGLGLDGRAFRFVGFNDYGLTSKPGGYTCGRSTSKGALDSAMKRARADGATVVRTWFFQSYYQGSRNHWAPFNRVLSAASARGLKVVPVLVNEWRDCEPSAKNKDLGFFSGGYRARGYGYPLSFRSYATTMASHYASDPRIAFWQIGNELESNAPSGCDSGAERAGADALRSFADDVTAAIKSADPNHLVSLGTIGSGQCGLAGPDYRYVHAGRVDLCEYHDYNDVTQALPDDGYNRLAQRLDECAGLGKPLVVGESGIPANVGSSGQAVGKAGAATLQRRARFFQAKMTAAFANGAAGYLLWQRTAFPSTSSRNLGGDGFGIGPSDPTDAVVRAQAASLLASAGS